MLGSIDARLRAIEQKLDMLTSAITVTLNEDHSPLSCSSPDADVDADEEAAALVEHMNRRRAEMHVASLQTIPTDPLPQPPQPPQPPQSPRTPIDPFMGLTEAERPKVINKYARMTEAECTRVQIDLFNRAKRIIVAQYRGNGMTEEEIENSLDTTQTQELIIQCANDLEKQWLAE